MSIPLDTTTLHKSRIPLPPASHPQPASPTLSETNQGVLHYPLSIIPCSSRGPPLCGGTPPATPPSKTMPRQRRTVLRPLTPIPCRSPPVASHPENPQILQILIQTAKPNPLPPHLSPATIHYPLSTNPLQFRGTTWFHWGNTLAHTNVTTSMQKEQGWDSLPFMILLYWPHDDPTGSADA